MIDTKNKKLILIGEQHGIKEIPKFLINYFSELNEDINICLEIPKNFQDKIEDFFKIKNNTGLCNNNYLKFILKIKKLNFEIFCIDFNYQKVIKNQNEAEKIMKDNILEVMQNGKKTFVILGNVHAYKKKIFNIDTVGFLINSQLKFNLMSINIINSKTNCPTDGFDKTISLNSIKYNGGKKWKVI